MRNCLLLLLMTAILFSCKNKKKSLAGDEKVEMADFVEAFPTVKLPYTITDTSFDLPSVADTIAHGAFTQIIPDTVLNNPFGTDRKITIEPIGKFGEKGKEAYLVARVKSRAKSAIYLLVLNKKNAFAASMPLIIPDKNTDIVESATIDSRLNISIQKNYTKNDEALYRRTIYAYNNVGIFSIVMTETNDQSGVANNINNALDTLPAKNKYSGDYTKSAKNFLTIRDGGNADSYLFFVHFENEEGEPCNGELKGEFILSTPTSAVFKENDTPCIIDFVFTGNQVKVKEQGSCGSHRGITCFFNDTYTRKKAAKPQKKEVKQVKKK